MPAVICLLCLKDVPYIIVSIVEREKVAVTVGAWKMYEQTWCGSPFTPVIIDFLRKAEHPVGNPPHTKNKSWQELQILRMLHGTLRILGCSAQKIWVGTKNECIQLKWSNWAVYWLCAWKQSVLCSRTDYYENCWFLLYLQLVFKSHFMLKKRLISCLTLHQFNRLSHHKPHRAVQKHKYCRMRQIFVSLLTVALIRQWQRLEKSKADESDI